ncbi:MAG: divergent polysaccharide deacetylase family protein [Fidelibacterota bacterium]
MKNESKIYQPGCHRNTRSVYTYLGFLLISTLLLFAGPGNNEKSAKISSTDSKGKDILINQVKYSLHYFGLRLHEPVKEQDDYTIVYKLPYNEVSEKILQPIRQVLEQHKLQAGKLTVFPKNQGFSYRVLYKYKHVGNIIVLNERTVGDKKHLIPTKKTKAAEPVKTAKMAIIIDDFGYSSGQAVQKLLELDIDITVAIIPGRRFSSWTSRQAAKNGKEVIIHMPMASDQEHLNNGESRFILSNDLSADEIQERVNRAFANIPNAVGMNNHMGSIATTQVDVVIPLVKALKQKKLYFIDSLTSPLSVVYENCLINDVPTGKRRYFLDNVREKEAIIKQLRLSIRYARENGQIIVTGHANPETLSAINYLQESGELAEVNILPASKLLE